jgi:ArsR family transcriptional regulator, arsenate/arsenite/antimonite-responsive transcriptional repressor
METRKVIAALAALAQETRLAIYRMLVEKGPAGMPAGAIAEALGVPPSSLSFHLAQLNHAGLITQRRASRLLIYSANYEAMNALVGYLAANCCGFGTSCPPVCEPGQSVPATPVDNGAVAAGRKRRC